MKEKNGITYLDLGKGVVDRKTAGWSDKQIHNYDRGQLVTQLDSARMVLDTLRDSMRDQENRIRDLERLLRRKQELVEEGYRPPQD